MAEQTDRITQEQLQKAKERAAELRKEVEPERPWYEEYGFASVREFVLYHWDKLSEQDKEELRKSGVEAPTCD